MNAETRLVFIVEDDEGVRGSLRALLEASSYAVKDYASAEQLLSTANIREAGCIVLDHNLPGMTGLELIEVMRVQGVHTPAIIVSGSRQDLIARAARAGVAAVLRKPMAAEALMVWLDEIFATPR
jgi:FixJ family two-component response regulator